MDFNTIGTIHIVETLAGFYLIDSDRCVYGVFATQEDARIHFKLILTQYLGI